MFLTTVVSLLVAVSDAAPEYGEVYIVENAERQTPRLHLSVNYASGVSNSFLYLNSITANAQFRLWKFLSTGVMGQVIKSELNDAGDQLDRLNQSGFIVNVPSPRWGIFSHSQLDLILGKWNVFNLLPLQVDLLVGGGVGVLQKRDDLNGASHSEISYLWSVEQRTQIYESVGLTFSAFGHLGGVYLGAGLFANIL